jgi:hypothetical protein
MSYTTITIEGQQIGLRFGYPCVRWFTEAGVENKDFFEGSKDKEGNQENTTLSEIGIAKLVQFAYENECAVKEIKPEIIFEKFYEWVEQRVEGELSNELSEVLTVWAGSIAIKRLVEKTQKKSQESQNEQTLTPSNESSTEKQE